jgi:hypothetical protein
VKAFFESIQVEQSGNRAVLTAELPRGFLRKLVSEAPAAVNATPPAPEPQVKQSPKKKQPKK